MIIKEEAIRKLKPLTKEQEEILKNAAGKPVNEKELYEKLGIDEETFETWMHTLREGNERMIFAQNVSPEELAAVSGGYDFKVEESQNYLCTETWLRVMYRIAANGQRTFPNCAATVEDGSWCGSNDACYEGAVQYICMEKCKRSWR